MLIGDHHTRTSTVSPACPAGFFFGKIVDISNNSYESYQFHNLSYVSFSIFLKFYKKFEVWNEQDSPARQVCTIPTIQYFHTLYKKGLYEPSGEVWIPLFCDWFFSAALSTRSDGVSVPDVELDFFSLLEKPSSENGAKTFFRLRDRNKLVCCKWSTLKL